VPSHFKRSLQSNFYYIAWYVHTADSALLGGFWRHYATFCARL